MICKICDWEICNENNVCAKCSRNVNDISMIALTDISKHFFCFDENSLNNLTQKQINEEKKQKSDDKPVSKRLRNAATSGSTLSKQFSRKKSKRTADWLKSRSNLY